MVTLGGTVHRARVAGGLTATAPLVAADSFRWPVGQDESLTMETALSQTLTAPVLAGTKVGQAVFYCNGTEVGRVDLLCGADVLPQLDSPLDAFRQIPLRQAG